MITRLEQLVEAVKGMPTMKLVVACGEDPHTIEAVSRAKNEGLVNVTMVGDSEKISQVAEEHGINPKIFEIIDERDTKKALKLAVKMVKDGEGDILMKGLVNTADYMRAILDKEVGLVPQGGVLSHVTVVEVPAYPKLLVVADVAVIILPDLDQKVKILQYTIDVAHALNIKMPYAFLISAVENVTPKMPSTIDAAIIKVMAERGQIKGAKVDGPVALDIAISKECAEIKGFREEGAGEADILIFPNIETGNVFFKTCTQLANGRIAAIVAGAIAPCVLTSRADSEDSKFLSIALAALMAGRKGA